MSFFPDFTFFNEVLFFQCCRVNFGNDVLKSLEQKVLNEVFPVLTGQGNNFEMPPEYNDKFRLLFRQGGTGYLEA